MQITVSAVSPKGICRTLKVSDVKEAKSVAMHISKATMVAVYFFDGEDMVQIECFPGLGKPKWKVDMVCANERRREKNEKFLKKFLKSAYSK